MISITELAELYGVSIRTIRYYEEMGLINKSVRIKGKRYFTKSLVLDRMNEIIFLKSLDFKLKDILLTMENPLYIKPLLINIRLEIVRMKIANLQKEASKIEDILRNYNWPEIVINDKLIFKKMSSHYNSLAYQTKKVEEKNTSLLKIQKNLLISIKNGIKKLV
ncbi:MerR family transcriptional regulator [Enterococcus faecalis]|uniref:MerR family transcriptional regulator n=1 Tax=Enterococcus faecalis TaxID=1351 RepID=UPI002090587D|nr:MerR family transcriptional regulator [Enterococcus faecalis]MCO5446234.1 MerR family transcriptional regulator [Enterococcus faecalis]